MGAVQELTNYSQAGKFSELIQAFEKEKALFLVYDGDARHFCLVILPMVADSYEKMGERRKAAYYYSVTARIALELGLQKSVAEESLHLAERLDPTCQLLKKIKTQLE